MDYLEIDFNPFKEEDQCMIYNVLLSSIQDKIGGTSLAGNPQPMPQETMPQNTMGGQPLPQAVNPMQSIMQAMSVPQTAYMANMQNNVQLPQMNYGNQNILPSMLQNMWQNQYNQGQASPTIARPFMGDGGMKVF